MRPQVLLRRLRDGHLANVRLRDVHRLLTDLGFRLDRRSGSHRIYLHPNVPVFLNLQDVDGHAKPYQLRQLLGLIERYALDVEGQA
jgi:predicted RNA binding protein YcfA (HicA-like mRNA interferase family)